MNLSFYKGKKVFLTGHTGFKGTWLSRILIFAGAKVTGYALEPPTSPSLFAATNTASQMKSIIGDIRDREKLVDAVKDAKPDIVLHLAAQPIVRTSYKDPVGTYETNVIGTVNVLEGVRHVSSVKSFVNITTDKVYK
ncbi:MAG: NAD-dependent epimerase/dehydratase family protein, partial [Treponema sp.]|nr:NAD-dependent epimerase/dehydratase family protein [Treponema sp.]